MDNRIIVVDDERDFLDSVKRGLVISGMKNVRIEEDPVKAASLFENGELFDIALIDITMPVMDGKKLLEIIKSNSPRTECIMITAVDEARVAINCLRTGAYDYLVKPISKENLVLSVNRALERKRLLDLLDIGKSMTLPELSNKQAFEPIVTRSQDIYRILKEAELHAQSDLPVLITGESGTGKELLARAIHAASARAEFRFTAVNMASMSPSLFDAEFFGHTKGAFTGADKDREGYLEYSDRGTLFLDEIGSLPLELQGKLLRVLQDGQYVKLGSSEVQTTDVRIIAASNINLEKMVAQNSFRKDLYYRLKGGWLHLPPLKDRKDDIPLLVSWFLEESCGPGGANIEEKAMSVLMDYDYPGNVRELRSIIQAAVNLAQRRPISVKFLPGHMEKRKSKPQTRLPSESAPMVSLAEAEKAHILKTYYQLNKNKSQTAKVLGISMNTLRRKIEFYEVD